jgi:hypothetical protein
MKKLLLLTVLLFSIVSCTEDDCVSKTCIGNAWVRCNGSPVREVIQGIEYNCETGELITQLPEGCEFLGWDNPDTP